MNQRRRIVSFKHGHHWTMSSDLTRPSSRAPSRLMSIDALRGFDMFWIVGGDRVARALGRWLGTPESRRFAEQFEHVKWEGFRFYDLIFPLFLFLVGVVLPFSLKKYQAGDEPKRAAFLRIARRVILLFLLGLIYNNMLQFQFESQRYTRRLAADCDLLRHRGNDLSAHESAHAGDLVSGDSDWLLGRPDVMCPRPSRRAGDLTMETSLAGYLDRHYLPGKINPGYYGFGDNEGLLSTIPAVATALLGVLAGHWLISSRGRWIKAAGLALGGLACLGLGMLWGRDFPVIKILWTSTYVLVAGGWSLLLLALVLHDHRRHRLARLVVLLRRHRRQRNHDLRCVADHSLFGDIAVSSGRSRPALGLIWPGAYGDRNPGDRMAAAAPSLPQQDFLAGLSRKAHARRILVLELNCPIGWPAMPHITYRHGTIQPLYSPGASCWADVEWALE